MYTATQHKRSLRLHLVTMQASHHIYTHKDTLGKWPLGIVNMRAYKFGLRCRPTNSRSPARLAPPETCDRLFRLLGTMLLVRTVLLAPHSSRFVPHHVVRSVSPTMWLASTSNRVSSGDRSQLLDLSARPALATALTRLHVAINTTAKLAVCTDCGCAVGASPGAYTNHANKHHQGRGRNTNDLAQLDELQRELGLAGSVAMAAPLVADTDAIHGLMLEYRHQCTCGFASASEYARVNRAADHAGVQWTVSAMQRVVKGHAYVRVCVPEKTRTAAVASGEPAAEAAVAATVAAAMTDGREARLQAVLTTPVNCHDEMSTDVGAGDHTVQTFQRQMGWHMPLDRRMTPDLAEALVGNSESDVERRVDAVVERWMARWVYDHFRLAGGRPPGSAADPQLYRRGGGRPAAARPRAAVPAGVHGHPCRLLALRVPGQPCARADAARRRVRRDARRCRRLNVGKWSLS
jgi:hypothetical protein